MQNPTFNGLQFMDAPTLITAFNAVNSGIGDFNGKVWAPGLVRPDQFAFSTSGLTLSYTGASPFGVLFSGGLFSTCHGTQAGVDSQTGSVSFSSLLPSFGSQIAYLVASYAQVLQNPISVPGPPPNNPAYNPNYIATIGYTANRDTLSIYATTAVPDNVNYFELGRVSLSSNSTGLPGFTTQYRLLSAPWGVSNINTYITASAAVNLPPASADAKIAFYGAVSATLPAISGSNGLIFNFLNFYYEQSEILTQGEGFIGYPASTSTIILNPGDSVSVLGNGAASAWQVINGNAGGLGIADNPAFYFISDGGATTGTVSIPSYVNRILVSLWGGGGGGGGGINGEFGAGEGGGGGGFFRTTYTIPFSGSRVLSYIIGSGGFGGAISPSLSTGDPGGFSAFSIGNIGATAYGGGGGYTASGSPSAFPQGGGFGGGFSLSNISTYFAVSGQSGFAGFPGYSGYIMVGAGGASFGSSSNYTQNNSYNTGAAGVSGRGYNNGNDFPGMGGNGAWGEFGVGGQGVPGAIEIIGLGL